MGARSAGRAWLLGFVVCALVVSACVSAESVADESLVNDGSAVPTSVAATVQPLAQSSGPPVVVGDPRWPLVGIEARGCGLVASTGSGFAFADDDLVVTTAHTVAGATDLLIVDADNESATATVRYFDPTKDIAVLHVPGLAGEPLELARALLGEPAWIYAWRRTTSGEPRAFRALDGSVTRRLLVTIEDIWVQGSYERNAIEVEVDVISGDSGGPVLNQAGQVIGMIYGESRERQVAFALDDREIKTALDAARANDAAVPNGRCV